MEQQSGDFVLSEVTKRNYSYLSVKRFFGLLYKSMSEGSTNLSLLRQKCFSLFFFLEIELRVGRLKKNKNM